MGSGNKWTRNQKLLLGGLIVAVAVPFVLHLLKKPEVKVINVDGDVGAVGNNVNVTIDKRTVIDINSLFEKTMMVSEAKGRAEFQVDQLKDDLAKAIKRGEELEAKGENDDASKALQQLREKGDTTGLLELLIKERDKHKDALIDRDNEIGVVAYLRGDIKRALDTAEQILGLEPNNLKGLSLKGMILLLQGGTEETKVVLERYVDIAKTTHNEKAEAIGYGNLGLIYKRMGKLDKAEELQLKALKINKKVGALKLEAINYNNLGLIYGTRGEFDRSEEMHNNALEIGQKVNDSEMVAAQYSNLGAIYHSRGDIDKAENMWFKALEFFEKTDNNEGMTASYSNLAGIYLGRGDKDKSEKTIRKALEFYEKVGNIGGMAVQYGNLGIIYQKGNDLDKAEEMQHRALEANEKIGNLEGMANDYWNLGSIYNDRRDCNKAREYLVKSQDICKKIGMRPEIEKAKYWISELEKNCSGRKQIAE